MYMVHFLQFWSMDRKQRGSGEMKEKNAREQIFVRVK